MQTRVAVTIGNFDGVHAGHVALLRRARELVGRASSGGRVVAMAFHPHPLRTLRPEAAPAELTTWAQREALLRESGADLVVRLAPAQELLSLTPRAFIEQVVGEHAPAWIVEGEDFRFGHRRTGDVALLQELGAAHGFAVEVVGAVTVATSDQLVAAASSSLVRWLLEEGRVRDAAAALGRPYSLSGVVREGHRRGRAMGFPTANLSHETLAPRDGVYAAWATLPGGDERPAAVSVGTNPTFGDGVRSVEAHILDWDGGGTAEYGWPLTIRFGAWLRDQAVYSNIDDLARQIRADVAHTRRALGGEAPAWRITPEPEHAPT